MALIHTNIKLSKVTLLKHIQIVNKLIDKH